MHSHIFTFCFVLQGSYLFFFLYVCVYLFIYLFGLWYSCFIFWHWFWAAISLLCHVENIQEYTFHLGQPCARSDIDCTPAVSIRLILQFWDKIITSSNLFPCLLVGGVFCCLLLFFFFKGVVVLETVCTRLALCFLWLQGSGSTCLKDGFITPSEQTQWTEQSYFVQNMSSNNTQLFSCLQTSPCWYRKKCFVHQPLPLRWGFQQLCSFTWHLHK